MIVSELVQEIYEMPQQLFDQKFQRFVTSLKLPITDSCFNIHCCKDCKRSLRICITKDPDARSESEFSSDSLNADLTSQSIGKKPSFFLIMVYSYKFTAALGVILLGSFVYILLMLFPDLLESGASEGITVANNSNSTASSDE
mmetsp:Transcript_5007/g.8539  ORF Transcript_5007/g.8539 Transcript_5007/m.8539 type:complete len:143 (+) Transcript_5007:364-792(+)